MNVYQTKDFGPIHYPDDKPKRCGGYVTTEHLDFATLQMVHSIQGVIGVVDQVFQYWNGRAWILESGDPSVGQKPYWFGLKEKAK